MFTQQPDSVPQHAVSCHDLTLRSVLRIQTKVQTRGLLADLSTMKPPGPFSPLRREMHRGLLSPAILTASWPSWTVVKGAI